MDYLLHIVVLASLYGVLAISLDLVAGHTGSLSLAHAAFFGMGAYSAAVLAASFGTPLWMNAICGIALAAVSSLVLSAAATRLKHDYLVVAVLAFQMLVYSVCKNWTSVTGGPVGISRIPAATIGGLTLNTPASFAVVSVCLLLAVLAIANRVTVSPYGRVLHSIRDDELLATVMGRKTALFKISIFSTSAAIAASAGVLYAHYLTYIEPSSFDLTQSLLVLAMVLIGGPATALGGLLGAFTLVMLPEALRFVHVSLGAIGHVRQILYGGLLIAIVVLRPQGLVGRVAIGR